MQSEAETEPATEPETASAEADCGALAAKLNRLIGQRYPDDRARPGYAKLAATIRERTGRSMSATYLWELVSGRKRNLTQDTLGTLAAFFEVPAGYLLDDPPPELAQALRNTKVRTIALRAEGLSDDTLDAVLAMLTEARRAEHLA